MPSDAESLQGERGVIKPAFHHLLLKTTRLAEMKRWYAVTLGTEVQFEWEAGAFLYNDSANHRLVFITTPKLSDDPDKFPHTGLDHFAFEYGSLEDLLDSYTRLKGEGIEPFLCLDHGLTTSFYYSDPDSNGLELQCDNFDDWAQSSAFMRTNPEFAANPIGQHVDPQQLIEAVRSGVSRQEIREISWRGGYPPATPGEIRIPM